MSNIEIFLLALALSIDACVVSFTYGLAFNQDRLKNSLQLALFTGVFQGLMPVVGYYLTTFVKSYIAPYASLIVFLIFTYLGVKFIKEAFDKKQVENLCIGFKCLLLIGIATSIDAFSAGISLSLYGNKILIPALIIALITFINSLIGFGLGGVLKKLPTKSMEVLAGILLILLGIKAVI